MPWTIMTTDKTVTFGELTTEIRELSMRFSMREMALAILIVKWKRRRAVNTTASLTPWLCRDLGLSE